jgi:2-desacetyl-2-hydroxyethyl bacteriochlorophyllide A dehydrogenase
MMTAAKALWHLNAKQSAVQAAQFGPASEEGVRVRSLFSLISTGTERLVATGQVPPSLYQQMGVPFMEGNFEFPIKYGYSLVGEVDQPGHAWHQKKVHLLHPHQDQLIVPPHTLYPIPPSIPPQRAVLASNMETALNAVWDSGVSAGDKVLLVGFGNVGSLLARILKAFPGMQLQVWDRDPWRAELAQKMGFAVQEPQKPNAFDLAFHTTGHGEALQTCVDAVGYEGKVIELSWYGNREVSLQLGRAFHVDRKQIISSQVSRIPTARLHRWDYRRRKDAVFRLLEDPGFDEHLTEMVPFAALPAWFDRLRRGDLQGLMWGVSF